MIGYALGLLGIQPHVTARPTIEGIAAGRDEVLEVATRLAAGAAP